MFTRILAAIAVSTLVSGSVVAGEADVVKVSVERARDDSFRFHVTLRHNDEGWDHYADAWEVTDAHGKVFATRVLAHPHVNEQPFTRSMSGINIPEGIKTVIVRAHDKIHAYGGNTKNVALPDR